MKMHYLNPYTGTAEVVDLEMIDWRIKGAAALKCMNQGALAQAIGMTASEFSHAKREGYSETMLRKIAEVLGTTVEWLKTGNDEIQVIVGEGAYMPVRAHVWDAGLDLFMPDGNDETLFARDSLVIDTKVHVMIPEG